MKTCWTICAGVVLLGLSGMVRAEEASAPLTAAVYVVPQGVKGSPELVRGTLVRHDATEFVLATKAGHVTLQWTQLTPGSAFALRSRLIDRNSAADWFALGQFAWGINAPTQAGTAFGKALELDKSYKDRIDAAKKEKPGGLLRAAAEAAKKVEHAGGISAGGENGALFGQTHDNKPVKLGRTTAAEDAAALAAARKHMEAIGAEYKVKLVEAPGKRVVVFTDLPAEQREAVVKAADAAVETAMGALGLAAGETLHMGKVPVLVLSDGATVVKAAEEFDSVMLPAEVPGYFTRRGTPRGHVGMNGGHLKGDAAAREAFTQVLRRELVQAVVARHVSTRELPAWLARGLADALASERRPNLGAREAAAKVAGEMKSIQALFAEEDPQGPWPAVMLSLVDMLAEKDAKALAKLVTRLKEGAEAGAALQETYGVDWAGLEKMWRGWVEVGAGEGG